MAIGMYSSDAQLQKNAADVTGYLSKLQSAQSKYSFDSKNPIINPAHLEQINVALDKVIDKIVLLENASSSETRTDFIFSISSSKPFREVSIFLGSVAM